MMPATSSPWVDGLTIGDVLRQTAAKFPDKDAVVFPRLDKDGQPNESGHAEQDCFRLNFREFDEAVDRVARALLGIGIEKGMHVAVWATNWPRWVLLQLATARIGAVMVTVNPANRSSEVAYVLKQSDAAALFLVDQFKKSNYFEILADAVPELANETAGQLKLADYPRLRHVVSMKDHAVAGMSMWDEFLSQGDSVEQSRVDEIAGTLTANDPINIQYTSGTTGFPKGAMLSHRNLLLNAYHIGDCQKITADDRICVPVPFYHCFGCVLGVLCCSVYGAGMIVPAEYFDPEAALEAIEAERATAIYGVPTMFIAQLEHATFSSRDLSSLRTGIMAGSPCPIEVMNRVVDDMGAREVTIAYGLTEASPVITQTRTDDQLELRVKTVGRPIPDIEVKLVDPGTGETLGNDEQGELCTRGHVVMLGYYNMPEQTAAAIDADGWLHSGDLATRMSNGYYRITGRIKDMICRGGENIYPREIEEFLYTHPAVEDVAVVGIPDKKFVEDVAAWIKLKDNATATEEELREFCSASLAHFKVPRHFRFVDEFPQTVTGKIQKFKIRESMIEELGLEQTETA
jgi:fatty-acyl-CoA synthase